MSLLSKLINDATQGAEQAFEDTADAAQDVADAFEKAGKQFVDAVDDAGDALTELVFANMIGIRSLRAHERSIIRRVYSQSLPPLDRILVVSLNGISGRAFAVPASLLATLAVPLLQPVDLTLIQMVIRPLKPLEYYLLFLGRRGYNNAIHQLYDVRPGDTLIHETAHVWQGFNRAFTWAYIFESVYYQTTEGSGAYAYSPGRQWDTYGPEEQASIVEDWYANGELTSDPLFPYIKSNVRQSSAHGATDFSSGSSSPVTTPALSRPAARVR